MKKKLFKLSRYISKTESEKNKKEIEDNLFRNALLVQILQHNSESKQDYLDYVLNQSLKLTGSKIGYIYLYSEKEEKFTINTWSKEVMEECNVEKIEKVYELNKAGLWGEVVRKRKPIIVNDYKMPHELKKGIPKGHVEMKNFIAIPVIVDGEIVATLGMGNKEKDYDDNDIFQMTTLMNGVWNSLKRKEFMKDLELERNKYIATLLSIGDGVIVINNENKITLINNAAEILLGYRNEEIVGRYYKEIYNLNEDSILISKDGKTYNIEDSSSPIKDSSGDITGLVIVFRDVTQKMEQIKEIEFLSFHDSLTGLYNRRFFQIEMKRLDTQRSYPLTIIMADLNGLKLINDAFGHIAGDELLISAANLLKDSFREEDIVCRWGGDEFVVLLPNTTDEDAEIVVNRINKLALQGDRSRGVLSISFGWETKNNKNEDIGKIFNKAEAYMYKKKMNDSNSLRGENIKTIMNTLYEKSPRERDHSQRVCELATNLARKLKISKNQLEDINTMSLLHDIGKIIISPEILDKPGKLDENEWIEIKKHPDIGYRIIGSSYEMGSLALGILHHHERFDGKGYPKGIKGEDIPIESRIIALADSYDAMTGDRPYRIPLTKEEAVKEIKKNSGTQFDLSIAKVFVEDVLEEKW